MAQKKPLETLPRLQAVLGQCRQALGAAGRVVVRYSGTENKIRLLVEARDEADVRRWMAELSRAVRKELAA